ncbi:hypothetical protein H696_04216 [Fonticula alba]|uniref:SH3 domain-containing protein n=1 Tax=Fonticula alba TaxID=691883 RepID=A0A058Z5I9_FONAL|nr:hypothetical protein H696_04216 [Fonticula alba]KCV68797.1 hypothetical protein H696_04216 [Fonticula alba]|eukprot:XP_009496368.1 hypothetical protein H696_04216 [Fonticula alba]
MSQQPAMPSPATLQGKLPEVAGPDEEDLFHSSSMVSEILRVLASPHHSTQYSETGLQDRFAPLDNVLERANKDPREKAFKDLYKKGKSLNEALTSCLGSSQAYAAALQKFGELESETMPSSPTTIYTMKLGLIMQELHRLEEQELALFVDRVQKLQRRAYKEKPTVTGFDEHKSLITKFDKLLQGKNWKGSVYDLKPSRPAIYPNEIEFQSNWSGYLAKASYCDALTDSIANGPALARAELFFSLESWRQAQIRRHELALQNLRSIDAHLPEINHSVNSTILREMNKIEKVRQAREAMLQGVRGLEVPDTFSVPTTMLLSHFNASHPAPGYGRLVEQLTHGSRVHFTRTMLAAGESAIDPWDQVSLSLIGTWLLVTSDVGGRLRLTLPLAGMSINLEHRPDAAFPLSHCFVLTPGPDSAEGSDAPAGGPPTAIYARNPADCQALLRCLRSISDRSQIRLTEDPGFEAAAAAAAAAAAVEAETAAAAATAAATATGALATPVMAPSVAAASPAARPGTLLRSASMSTPPPAVPQRGKLAQLQAQSMSNIVLNSPPPPVPVRGAANPKSLPVSGVASPVPAKGDRPPVPLRPGTPTRVTSHRDAAAADAAQSGRPVDTPKSAGGAPPPAIPRPYSVAGAASPAVPPARRSLSTGSALEPNDAPARPTPPPHARQLSAGDAGSLPSVPPRSQSPSPGTRATPPVPGRGPAPAPPKPRTGAPAPPAPRASASAAAPASAAAAAAAAAVAALAAPVPVEDAPAKTATAAPVAGEEVQHGDAPPHDKSDVSLDAAAAAAAAAVAPPPVVAGKASEDDACSSSSSSSLSNAAEEEVTEHEGDSDAEAPADVAVPKRPPSAELTTTPPVSAAGDGAARLDLYMQPAHFAGLKADMQQLCQVLEGLRETEDGQVTALAGLPLLGGTQAGGAAERDPTRPGTVLAVATFSCQPDAATDLAFAEEDLIEVVARMPNSEDQWLVARIVREREGTPGLVVSPVGVVPRNYLQVVCETERALEALKSAD